MRSEAAKASDTNQETRARLMSLDNAMSMVSERLATVENQAESRESAGREATSSGPQLFAITSGKSLALEVGVLQRHGGMRVRMMRRITGQSGARKAFGIIILGDCLLHPLACLQSLQMEVHKQTQQQHR